MGMTLKGVWLFAALPADVPTVTWVYKYNQGLSVVHSDRTGTKLRHHPLMEHTLLVPCVTFGEVGVANHTFDNRPVPVLQRRALRDAEADDPVIGADEPRGVSLLQHSARLLRPPQPQADRSMRPPSPPPVAVAAPSAVSGAAPDAAAHAASMPAIPACPAVLRTIATPCRRRATHVHAVSEASCLPDRSAVLRPLAATQFATVQKVALTDALPGSGFAADRDGHISSAHSVSGMQELVRQLRRPWLDFLTKDTASIPRMSQQLQFKLSALPALFPAPPDEIHIFTDGAFYFPDHAGWAVVVVVRHLIGSASYQDTLLGCAGGPLAPFQQDPAPFSLEIFRLSSWH